MRSFRLTLVVQCLVEFQRLEVFFVLYLHIGWDVLGTGRGQFFGLEEVGLDTSRQLGLALGLLVVYVDVVSDFDWSWLLKDSLRLR